MYPHIEKFLEKYDGYIMLVTVKKYGLFFVSICHRGTVKAPVSPIIAEVGQATLEECMAQLEIQIGRGDVY